MARGTPTALKGTLLAGTQQGFQLITTIKNACTAYLSNGEPAWEVTEIDPATATYDIMLHSVGDRSLGSGSNKGDIDIWASLKNAANNLFVNAYLDFCPNDDSSRRKTLDRNVNINDETDLDYWILVNEYECVAVISQSGGWYMIHFGHVVSGIEDTKIGGVARVATQTSGTGTVVVDLDRDISSQITVGQRIWLVNQTPDGAGTVEAEKIEIVVVDAITASTITLSGVTNDAYSVGSLVGLYRGYNYAHAHTSFRYFYQWVAIGDATGPINYAYPDTPGGNFAESGQDPDQSSIYRLYNVVFNWSLSRGSPGRPQHTLSSPVGTQNGGDRMLVGGDTSNAYWVFPGLLINTSCLCIGPGATV